MAGGASDAGTLDRYAGAQARLEHAGGYNWRERAMATVRGLGFHERDLDRPLSTFSGGELTRASLARDARRRPRPAAARRAHQPPRHRLARMARAAAHVGGRGGDPRGPRPLVPRVGRHRGAGARGRAVALLPRPLARLAQGAGGARAGARARDRAPAGGDRAPGALRRPASARARARARRSRARRSSTRWTGWSAHRATGAGLGFEFDKPSRSGRVVLELEGATLSAGEQARCSTTPSCGSSAAST